MPATQTQRPVTSRIFVPVVLFLGLVTVSIAPLSCGTESDDAPGEETSEVAESDTDRAILLNVGIEDETANRPLSDEFVIETPSGARWSPGTLQGAGATKAFEKHPVGETRTLRLYPEGEESSALEVPITMKPDMSSALASSRTEIVVYDDSIAVTGPAVPDEKVVLDRPSAPSSSAPSDSG